jgi:hypothetical protein
VNKLYFLTTFILLASAACGGSVTTGSGGGSVTTGSGGGGGSSDTGTTTTTSTTTDTCAPNVYAEPGCGDAPADLVVISAGCFEPCTTVGMHCSNGGTCQKAYTNPCLCNDPSGPCCNTCGGEQLLCVE